MKNKLQHIMDCIYAFKEIARRDKKSWKLFNMLNRDYHKYFNGIEYELLFRKIDKYRDKIVYRLNGYPHRTDGPAVIWNSGMTCWHYYGAIHRTDGPAMYDEHCNQWYVNHKRHRLDGPAIEFHNEEDKKYNEWWVNDVKINPPNS